MAIRKLLTATLSALLIAQIAIIAGAQADTSSAVDQSALTLAQDQSLASDAGDWPIQSFTSSVTGELTGVDLALTRDVSRTQSMHVDIYPIDINDVPMSDPVYGAQEVAANDISALATNSSGYHWTHVQFATPVPLVSRQKYAMRIVPDDDSASIHWALSSSLYAGGASINDGGGTNWNADESAPLEFGFATWMRKDSSVGSGQWAKGVIDSNSRVACGSGDPNCQTFSTLATNANGSKVFGTSSWGTDTIHSGDSGATYSSNASPYPLSDGSLNSATYFNNGAGILLGRNCNLWRSVDEGESFSRILDGGRDLACIKQVVSTNSGNVIVAVASGGSYYGRHQGIYISIDSGDTWNENRLEQSWKSVALSSDGSTIVAVADDGSAIMSTDSGANWTTLQFNLGTTRWNSVAMSGDGSRLFVSDGDRIYGATLPSADLESLSPEDAWTKIQASSDGSNIFALDVSGHIFHSSDMGHTWRDTGLGDIAFSDFALSGDATVLVASTRGAMYTFNWTDREVPTVEPVVKPAHKPTASSSAQTTSIQFVSGASKLSSQAKKVIRMTVKANGKSAHYVVTGAAGLKPGVSTKYVRALATNRATVVKKYLCALGVKKSHVTTKAVVFQAGMTPKSKILAKVSM